VSLEWATKGLHAYRNDLLAELILLVPEEVDVPVGYTVDLTVVFSGTVDSDQVVTIAVSDLDVLCAPSSVTVLTGESTVKVPVEVVGSGIATVTATHATGNAQSTISTHPHTSLDTLHPSIAVAESATASLKSAAPAGEPTGTPPILPTVPLRPATLVVAPSVSVPQIKTPAREIPGTWGGAVKFDGLGDALEYTGTQLEQMQDTGVISFRWRPDYNGTPVEGQLFPYLFGSKITINTVLFGHMDTGYIVIEINDWEEGSIIYSTTDFPFSTVSGTFYHIELSWDVTAGSGFGAELFIEGIKQGTLAGTGVRTSDVAAYGFGDVALTSLFAIDEIVYRTEVQHRSDFTPPMQPLEPPYDDDILLVGHFDDVGGQSFQWDYWKSGVDPVVTPNGTPEIISLPGNLVLPTTPLHPALRVSGRKKPSPFEG
jgi:hypothetical protein